MATVNVGDVLEVTYQMTLYGQRLLTVLHYKVTTAPTVVTDPLLSQADVLNEIKNGGAQDRVTVYRNCVSNNLNFDALTAQYVYPGRWRRSTLNINVAGSVSGSAGSANIAAVIEKTTDLAGKANRGSVHVPGIQNGQYSNGLIGTTLNNNLVLLADKLITTINESGAGAGVWKPIIFHRRFPATTSQIWNSYTIQQTVRVMRRRTVGVGK